MNRNKFIFSFAWVVALLVATPAVGQLNNFPILALPAGDGANTLGGGFGRGLGDQSGENNSVVAGYARTGETVSFGLNTGWVINIGNANRTGINFGGNLAYFVVKGDDQPLSVGIQGGIEYGSVNTDPRTTQWNFPIGVSFSGSSEAGSNTVRPWVMPRFQWTRTGEIPSGVVLPVTPSNTVSDFGASGGISIQNEGGVGVGVYLDWLLADDGSGTNDGSQWLLGFALFYTIQ